MGWGGAAHLFVYYYYYYFFSCARWWRLRLKSAPTPGGCASAVSHTSVPELEADHGVGKKKNGSRCGRGEDERSDEQLSLGRKIEGKIK